MINETELRSQVANALSGVRLLEHKFYVRWEAGELSPAELREYSEQYRHFEASLPETLSEILNMLPDSDARNFIADNLADETGFPSHLQLFESFVNATGGDVQAPAMPATKALVEAYNETLREGPASAIGGIVAYEIQSPEVATSKGEGLRKHYGYDYADTNFWDVHATLDVDHGDWAISAMASVSGEDASSAVAGTRKIAEAWWAFLDEREARKEVLAA